ncbi:MULTISPECIES: DUF4123 domain-containing protein [unclassified Pseudomonas]|uniref:DUF4123 domain-containing protein n=1 Tax=unclassified Pseudomonas TaxID=196821 RepID=UPI002AC8D984|nr:MULTISPECIES: DUF4123 domain-containing protein [unclassified Pseudomonas]MEB0048834.1 DUF4123 domain-containing protein [Pseudomonas sp. Dout3]MEB0099639.1 DUF4123 domain-containing protein [Pseudomonas sp. DC1.2]WPX58836.1 DUF4123 domain-containing protein [Pseudomonas sp. DC1.2]
MSQAYLLLDRAQIEHLPEQLFELGSTTYHPLYQTTAYSPLEDVGPVLVPVAPDSPLAQFFLQAWRATAGVWLESDAEESVVLDHLRSLIHVRVEGGLTVLFRYFDPRITALWLAHLPCDERDRLMGPVRLIQLPALDIRQENPDQPCARYAHEPWLSLTADLLERLSTTQRRCVTQQLIEHCQQHFCEYAQGLDASTLQQWAERCQDNAGRHGYGAIDEVLLWARFQVALGTDFPDDSAHAVYRQLLAEAGVSPNQRLENLDAELTRQLLSDTESCP